MPHRFFDYFLDKKISTCYLLTFTVLAVVLLFFKIFFLSSWYASTVNYQTEIASLRKRARIINKSHGIEILDSKLPLDNTELTLVSTIWDTFDVDQALDTLLAQAAQFGLGIKNCILQGEKKKQLYDVHHVLLKIHGTFSAIQKFFEKVTASKYALRCGTLRMVRPSDNETITANLILNFYKFHPTV